MTVFSTAWAETMSKMRTTRWCFFPIAFALLVLGLATVATVGVSRIVGLHPNDWHMFVKGTYAHEVVVWYLALVVAIVPLAVLTEFVANVVKIKWRLHRL